MTNHVYIICHGDTSFYKIGISEDVEGRLKVLQAANPIKLCVEFSRPVWCAKCVEKYLHAQYHECRVTGEWFELSGQEVKDIRYFLSQFLPHKWPEGGIRPIEYNTAIDEKTKTPSAPILVSHYLRSHKVLAEKDLMKAAGA